MREAARLFLLELLLLLVFLPPFLLLPWGRAGLPAAPAAGVVAAIGLGTGFYALWAARRAERREDWRAAAMLLGVGVGLWLWAAGLAFRLGSGGLAVGLLLGAGALSLLLFRFPNPPQNPPSPEPR